ncbi:hypothetical protein HanXRQr2_Chr16g0738971 [Helianthus annuus]|uniref:Uncharacterized protein n=1 Tax=Helianthus annuus TaxID=4232 RepID=A0A251RNA4_HELAN|nr:hypothetical protein HanXRQr2_Chr16g0738971 [Helianthus annuus]
MTSLMFDPSLCIQHTCVKWIMGQGIFVEAADPNVTTPFERQKNASVMLITGCADSGGVGCYRRMCLRWCYRAD